MSKRCFTLIPIVLLLFLAGCASRGEIETMKNQLNYLEKSSAQTQERIVLLDSLYRDALEKNVTYQADLKLILSDLLDKNNIVDGRLTDIEGRVEQILNRLEGGSARPLTTTPVADSTADSATSQAGLPRVDSQKMFDNAFDDLKRGNYDLAAMQFSEYINLFAETELADDAQYWLGECYYGKKDFAKAIPEFEKVEKTYPKSDKLVSALFKLGRSHQEAGNRSRAKAIFERIVSKYPDSFEAGPAAEKLKEL